MGIKIISTGSYTPEKIVTNEDLSKTLDTSDEWIASRTGIRARRIAVEGSTSELAVAAARAALAQAGIGAEVLGLVIVATSTPDNHFPSCACEVQGAIGAVNAVAFDLSAACTGFVFALDTAAAYLQTGRGSYALVIGADVMSKVLDWTDRSSCVLFGDGAGAVVLQASDQQKSDLLVSCMGAEGERGNVLRCGIRYHNTEEAVQDSIQMDGQEVFRFAVRTVSANIRGLMEKAEQPDLDGVKYFILHQANERIIESVAKRLGQPMEKFPVNLAQYGNTSAASIPIILDELNRAGKLNRGDRLVLAGFGAGLTYGASLMIF